MLLLNKTIKQLNQFAKKRKKKSKRSLGVTANDFLYHF